MTKLICGLLTTWLIAMPAIADEPVLPIMQQTPYQGIVVKEQFSHAKDLDFWFAQQKYTPSYVQQTQFVPPYFATNLPDDLASLPVANKINTFIQLLLPTVIKVNNGIIAVRERILWLQQQPALSAEEQQWLADISKQYGLAKVSFKQLLLRVNIIPVSMALAQGIDESGWGTSYFAIEANALFGEHLAKGGTHYVESRTGHIKVAAFDYLYQGVASYMHNLNSTHAYREMWQLRQQLAPSNRGITGKQLIPSLLDYSVRGQVYVDDLLNLIKWHDLGAYDNAVLQTDVEARLLMFSRKK